MTTMTVAPEARPGGPPGPRGPGPDPVHPGPPGRAHQDVRHPVRVLADGQHRRLGRVATAAVIAFAPDDQIDYDNFGAAIGIPMVVLLR